MNLKICAEVSRCFATQSHGNESLNKMAAISAFFGFFWLSSEGTIDSGRAGPSTFGDFGNDSVVAQRLLLEQLSGLKVNVLVTRFELERVAKVWPTESVGSTNDCVLAKTYFS